MLPVPEVPPDWEPPSTALFKHRDGQVVPLRSGGLRPHPHEHRFRRFRGRTLCDQPGCRAELMIPAGAKSLPGGVIIREGGLPGSFWCVHGVYAGLVQSYGKKCAACARGLAPGAQVPSTKPLTLYDAIDDLNLAALGLEVALAECLLAIFRRVAEKLDRWRAH